MLTLDKVKKQGSEKKEIKKKEITPYSHVHSIPFARIQDSLHSRQQTKSMAHRSPIMLVGTRKTQVSIDRSFSVDSVKGTPEPQRKQDCGIERSSIRPPETPVWIDRTRPRIAF